MRRALSAMPIAAQMPWPSEPVATSTNGSRGVGCPSRSDPILRSFSSSSRSKQRRPRPTRRRGSAPRGPSTARSDRSRDSAGRFGSKRISAKNSAAMMSAADSSWSDGRCRPRCVERTESMRSCAAMLRRTSIDTGTGTSQTGCGEVYHSGRELPHREQPVRGIGPVRRGGYRPCARSSAAPPRQMSRRRRPRRGARALPRTRS